MAQPVRYQVFLSSTYEDLREERQQATQAILEAGFFPSGMELFPASDDSQWALIKRVIEESDYYIIISAGRYGSLGPSGLSYTEMEYDYAIQQNVPVLGFVRSDLGEVPSGMVEKSEKGKKKLDAFRQKVMSKTCRLYSSPSELGMAVMKSLISEARVRPRVGWIRADQARSEEDIQRERKLNDELKAAEELIETLKREIRDRVVLGDEIPREALSQGSELFTFDVTFADNDKKQVVERLSLSWDEIFKIIGPALYGFIVKKAGGYGKKPTYPFQDTIEECLRLKVIDHVQGRSIKMQSSQIDTCVIQLKELGLIMFAENNDGEEVFRGVTLTELGERRLTLLSAQIKDQSQIDKLLSRSAKNSTAVSSV